MALNTRAKRRISILVILMLGVVVLGTGAWWGRQILKDRRAADARIRGLQAVESREWAAALPDLSTVVVNEPLDLESLRGLATARRRVPAPNNQHLRDSVNFARRAVEVAKQLEVDDEVLVETLLEAARVEYAIGALLNLEETCTEVVEIDPTNQEAIESLFQVKWVRGLFLPDQLVLTRKDGRDDREWLYALREAGDASALRWALEMSIADEGLRNRESIVRVLKEGRFEELQQIREGEIGESTLDIVEDWLAEGNPADPSLHFLLAVERVRSNDFAGARDALRVVEASDGVDADLLIRAANLREALGSEADRIEAADLLARAESATSISPTAASVIAMRHWSAVRPEDAQRTLSRAIDDHPSDVELVLNGLLLSALVGDEGDTDWTGRGSDLLSTGVLDALEFETLELVMKLEALSRQDLVTLEDFQNPEIALDSIASRENPLLQTLIGDIQARLGLVGQAIESWKRASRSLNGRSLEIGRRLIPGMIQNQELHTAFGTALELAANLRTSAAIEMLCRAWLALDRAGIDVREVQPNFDMWESPRDLASDLYEERRRQGMQAADSLVLLAEAVAIDGDDDALVALTRSGIESGVDNGSLIDLARINIRYETAIAEDMVRMIGGLELDAEDARRRLLLEMDLLRSRGSYAEAESKASLEVPVYWADRAEDIDRVICRELIANLLHRGTLDEDVVFRCVDRIESVEDLLLLFRFVVEQGNEPLAVKVYESLAERSGERNPVAAMAKAELVLKFPPEDPSSLNEAILLADELLAAGSTDVNLQISLARLLRMGPRPAFDRAIEVLRESVIMRPGRFDIALMLVDALQETGRYDEAAEYLQQISRRRNEASPQARRLLSALLAGQGDLGGMSEIACEIAAETGDVFDRLQCVQAKLMGGEQSDADAMLADLYADPNRPVEVDRAYAQRLADMGRTNEALDVLRYAPGFGSRRDLCFEVAQVAIGVEAWEEAERNLVEAESMAPDDRALKYLRAVYELRRPDGDERIAAQRLDEIQADPDVTARELRTVALLRMPYANLRDRIPSIANALRSDRPLEANFLQLMYDAADIDAGFSTSPELRERAEQIVRDPLATPAMWLLAIELERIAYGRALDRGAVFESGAIADNVVSLLEQASSRFATNNKFPRQLSEMLLVLGDYDGARLNAQETLRRSPRPGGLTTDHMALARVLANMDAYPDIVEVLEPFREEMIDSPYEFRRSVALLVIGHLGAGQVDEAWRIVKSIQGKVGSDGAAFLWLNSIPRAPSASLLRAYELIAADETLDGWSLVGSPKLIRAMTGADDYRLKQAYRSWREAYESRGLSLVERLQLVATADCIEFAGEPEEMLQRLQDAIDQIPPSLLERVMEYPDLTEEERQDVAPIRMLLSIAMNNFVAARAGAAIAAGSDPEWADRFGERAAVYADRLRSMGIESPQIVDTLAMHAMAEGRAEEGVELARRAVGLDPSNPKLRFNLAKALRKAGDVDAARDEARMALLLARRYPSENVDLIRMIEGFLAGL